MPWQTLIQTPQALFGRCGQLTAIGNKRICRENGGSGGLCEDREAPPLWARLLAESFCHVEKVGNVVHSQDAAASKRRIQDFVTSCEGTRVRCGGARSGLGAASLDHDNGFAEGYFSGRGKKRARIAYRLHVKQNAVCVRITAKVIDQVAPAHIQH